MKFGPTNGSRSFPMVSPAQCAIPETTSVATYAHRPVSTRLTHPLAVWMVRTASIPNPTTSRHTAEIDTISAARCLREYP